MIDSFGATSNARTGFRDHHGRHRQLLPDRTGRQIDAGALSAVRHGRKKATTTCRRQTIHFGAAASACMVMARTGAGSARHVIVEKGHTGAGSAPEAKMGWHAPPRRGWTGAGTRRGPMLGGADGEGGFGIAINGSTAAVSQHAALGGAGRDKAGASFATDGPSADRATSPVRFTLAATEPGERRECCGGRKCARRRRRRSRLCDSSARHRHLL